MAKSTNLTFEDFISDLADLVARYQGGENSKPATAAKAKAKASKAAEAEPVTEDDDEGIDFGEDSKPDIAVRRAALGKERINTLRKTVLALGYGQDDDGEDDEDAIAAVKEADKTTLVETILSEEYPEEMDDEDDEDIDDDDDDSDDADVDDEDDADDDDEDDEDEDDEEDDDEDDADEDEADEWTRDELEGMNLRELKRVAKEEFEYTTADLKGLDQETIIAMVLGEDEDAEDVEDDEDEDDDEGEYTEDELSSMTLNELKGLAKEYGLKVKPGIKKKALVEQILDLGDEE